jgi:hypothetical protein
MPNSLIREMPEVPADLARATTLFTRWETAKLLRCSVPNLDRRRAAGEIAPTKVGGRTFYSQDAIIAFCNRAAPVKAEA